MRDVFQQELEALTKQAVGIAVTVEQQVRDAVRAVIADDQELGASVVKSDDGVDQRCRETEERIIEVIATQHPVARDLRLLWSLNHVLHHLERMGDLSVNIAKVVRRSGGRRAPQTLYDLLQAQANLVARVVEASKEALDKGDLDLASRLAEMDEPIDNLHKQFIHEMAGIQEVEDTEVASMLVLSSRHLERIADNAVDIGERITYLVTGHMTSTDED